MSAAPRKAPITPVKVQMLKAMFVEAFGREMTPEEERLLLWAEQVAPSFEADDPGEVA
jgi:hypothetical protein